jgi:DinB superfamily
MSRRSRGGRIAAIAIVAALAAIPRTTLAQSAANRVDAIEVRKQFLADLDTLNVKFTALAQAFPDDKYSWRPGPGVRSVGEVFMHVASELYVYVPLVYGAQPSPVIPHEKGATEKFEQMSTKPDVLKHLAAGHAYAINAVSGADSATLGNTKTIGGHDYTIAGLSFAVADDLHEHLGQLIAYARMNGITPPWSKKR